MPLNRTTYKTLSQELLDELEPLGGSSVFQKGSLIFSEGDRADFLPVIISGKVKMLHFLEAGKEMIIDIFEKGEAFAIPPVFDGRKYPAAAVAMADTQMLMVPRKRFLEFLRRSPDLSFYVIGWMCGMLREKTATIQYLATASPDARVAHILLRLCENQEAEPPVRITLLRREIAEMAGITTETAIRAIRKLAEQEIIAISHGKIIVERPEALQKFLAYRA